MPVPVLVQVESSSGTLLFESDATPGQLTEMSVGDKVTDKVLEGTNAAVTKIGDVIRGCTEDLLPVFDDLATRRQQGGALASAVAELGLKVTGEGNVVVVKSTVEANVKVTLTWDFT
jgi:hypothetical protein